MNLSIVVTWIQQKLLDETISDSTLRYIGMCASTLATILYLLRYHYRANFMIRELCYYDYRHVKTPLSLIQTLALVGKDLEIRSTESIIQCTSGCLGVCIWGKDLKTNESIVLEALRRSNARYFHLNFGRAPWSGSFNRTLERMEETSNPLWSFLKQIAKLFTGNDSESSTEINSGYSDLIIMEEKLSRYKTLILEKQGMIKRIMNQDKNRVLIYFIEGLDNLAELDVNVGGAYGRKIVRILVQSFMDLAEAYPEHFRVIYSLSDKFWWRYWSGNVGIMRKCVSIHVGESDPVLVMKAWQNKYPKIPLETIRQIIVNWGTSSREIVRIISAYQLPTCVSLDKLIEEDILQFVFMWLNDRYYMLQNVGMNFLYDMIKADEGDGVSDKQILDVVASLELEVFRLIASKECGTIPLRHILQSDNGSKLFQASINLVRKDFLALSVVDSADVNSYKNSLNILGNGSCSGSGSTNDYRGIETVAMVLPECLEGIVLCTRKKIDVLSVRYVCKLLDESHFHPQLTIV